MTRTGSNWKGRQQIEPMDYSRLSPLTLLIPIVYSVLRWLNNSSILPGFCFLLVLVKAPVKKNQRTSRQVVRLYICFLVLRVQW